MCLTTRQTSKKNQSIFLILNFLKCCCYDCNFSDCIKQHLYPLCGLFCYIIDGLVLLWNDQLICHTPYIEGSDQIFYEQVDYLGFSCEVCETQFVDVCLPIDDRFDHMWSFIMQFAQFTYIGNKELGFFLSVNRDEMMQEAESIINTACSICYCSSWNMILTSQGSQLVSFFSTCRDTYI